MCDQKSYEAKPDSKETSKPTLMDDLMAFKKKYEDLAKEAKIKEIEKVKRKPLSDWTLPLTKEELEEFSKITGLEITLVELIADSIYISTALKQERKNGYITDVKAILWLAERFELTSNN